jgi:hypothetical protein
MDFPVAKILSESYIAVGSLFSTVTPSLWSEDSTVDGFRELLDIKPDLAQIDEHVENSGQYSNAPRSLQLNIRKLHQGGRIRIFAKVLNEVAIHRIYLLAREAPRPNSQDVIFEPDPRFLNPDVWPTDSIMQAIPHINVSPLAWQGLSDTDFQPFDPWATPEDGSLFYIFNTLPSPSPDPSQVSDQTSRESIQNLLDYNKPFPGLKTPLYPYQARSAAQMLQKESCQTTRMDPRFEARTGPDGKEFFYSPRQVTFAKSTSIYDSTRGGILAETMGLGYVLSTFCSSLTVKAKRSSVWR